MNELDPHTATQTVNPTEQLPAVADRHAKAVERKPRKAPADSIVNIVTAIAGVTAECGVVAKQGYNKFHNYSFAQMADILQQVTPLIGKHGLIIVQSEVSRTMLDDGRAVAVEYEFTLAHTSGEVWPDRPRQTGLCRCRDSKGGFDDKSFAKAHTAARKYFLLALFQIATGDEDDADPEQSFTTPPPPPRAAKPIGGASTLAPTDQPAAVVRASTPTAAGAVMDYAEYVERWAVFLGKDTITVEAIEKRWDKQEWQDIEWPDDDGATFKALEETVQEKIAALKAKK